jgi:pyrimidine operon attenuation protein / uracil phosphoribosyltransferase
MPCDDVKKTIFAQISNTALKTILDAYKINVVIERLAHQIIENNLDFSKTVLIGIQPRGIFLSDRIYSYLTQHLKIKNVTYGTLDITLYRDDVNNNNELRTPSETNIPFDIEGKNVLLIDDVLYTGRTIRSAFDALMDYGRPNKVELMVLIDRRFSREFPIQADYIGQTIDSNIHQKVKVYWQQRDKKDEVILIDN